MIVFNTTKLDTLKRLMVRLLLCLFYSFLKIQCSDIFQLSHKCLFYSFVQIKIHIRSICCNQLLCLKYF